MKSPRVVCCFIIRTTASGNGKLNDAILSVTDIYSNINMYCFYLPLVLRWRFIEFCKLRYFFRINILLQFPRRIFVLKRPPFDQEMPNCLPTGRISVSCFVQDSVNFDKVWIERIILGLKRKIVRTFVVEYVRFLNSLTNVNFYYNCYMYILLYK